jgi:hypothetical protein
VVVSATVVVVSAQEESTLHPKSQQYCVAKASFTVFVKFKHLLVSEYDGTLTSLAKSQSVLHLKLVLYLPGQPQSSLSITSMSTACSS